MEHINQVTLAGDARHRDVLESALFCLVECLPSIAAAEVWQADRNGTIRCTQGLAAGGDYYRPNIAVNGLLHDDDFEDFCLEMEPKEARPEVGADAKGISDAKGDSGGKKTKLGARYIPEGLVVRPRLTREILAAPFLDYHFKVGRSWIGADRLARGFALVLRIAEPAGTTNAGATPPQKGGSKAQREYSHRNIEDGAFAARVATEVGVALVCVRGREHRAAVRALALKRLSAECSKTRPSGEKVKSAVLTEISNVLPGCRAYIGVLQPGGDTLLYESATANSSMAGRELIRGEGVSFSCLDDPDGQTRVVSHCDRVGPTATGPPKPPSVAASATVGGASKPSNLLVGDLVEVWYASSWLPGTVLKDRGHQCYDVRYEDYRETEVGVPRWRLKELVTFEHLDVKVSWDHHVGSAEQDRHDKQRGDGGVEKDDVNNRGKSWPWPFVCVPLRSAGNRVGVLGVDGWAGVQLGRPEETHPEKAVLGFLKEAGSFLATTLYTERRNRGLLALAKTLRGKDATEDSALEALLVLLRETITFRRRVDVLETRASEPGVIYRRGTWESSPSRGGVGSQEASRACNPARVFKVGEAPRVEDLCITPTQLQRLGVYREGLTSSLKQQSLLLNETNAYQREIHGIAKDGPGKTSGLQARALSTRRGEIVGRFQRLAVRAGGGRPSADGWYLVRVSRALPEAPPAKRGKNAGFATKMESAAASGNSEDSDITLLSEMCRNLEVGFMAIASREQRAIVRVKALERVFACCKSLSVSPATCASPFALGVRTPSAAATAPVPQTRRAARKTASSDAATSNAMPVVPCSTARPDASAVSAAVTRAEDAIRTGRDLMFSAPIPSPTAAETPDGRKGALVVLKDGKLAVCVLQGDKRVAVVELPGGKHQTVAGVEVRVVWIFERTLRAFATRIISRSGCSHADCPS